MCFEGLHDALLHGWIFWYHIIFSRSSTLWEVTFWHASVSWNDENKRHLAMPLARISQQGGAKSHKGDHISKHNIGCTQQPASQTWNGGHRFQMVESGTTGPTAGDGPAFGYKCGILSWKCTVRIFVVTMNKAITKALNPFTLGVIEAKHSTGNDLYFCHVQSYTYYICEICTVTI